MGRKVGMIWLEMINIRAAGIIEAEEVLDICSQFYLKGGITKCHLLQI